LGAFNGKSHVLFWFSAIFLLTLLPKWKPKSFMLMARMTQMFFDPSRAQEW